ncbi:MAG: uL22 family ribosomal protein [Candidatus Aenigmatarchaeota archaeon]
MYTYKPKEKFAKSYGRNLRISTKSANVICSVIRGKKLNQAKRLLSDLLSMKRSLDGKYYTKTVREILKLLESCEKNADFLGLDTNKLFVHASAHIGSVIRRRRRKSAFGSRLKSTNVEIMLIEKGSITEEKKIEKEKESKEVLEIRNDEGKENTKAS